MRALSIIEEGDHKKLRMANLVFKIYIIKSQLLVHNLLME